MLGKNALVGLIVVLLASLFISNAFATTITPSYGLDYVTPSIGNWNSLSPSSWSTPQQCVTREFLYTAYNSPSNWQTWQCDYKGRNMGAWSDSGTFYWTIEEYMKGYINGQWTVIAIKLSTKMIHHWYGDHFAQEWEFKLYWQLNGGAWQSMGTWTTSGYDQFIDPVFQLKFYRFYDGTYHTKAGGQFLSGLSGSAYHDFGSGVYFSTPSVEQVLCKADAHASISTSYSGSRANDQLIY